jgi:hypothetical protein
MKTRMPEPSSPLIEMLRGASNVATPHGEADYPGLQVVAVPGWALRVIVPQGGQTIVALGGEHTLAYRLLNGDCAQSFRLAPGDRATCLRDDLPHSFAEWRLERLGAA